MIASLSPALWLLVLGVLAVAAYAGWSRLARRRFLRRRLEKWTALAEPLGYVAELQDGNVMIRGVMVTQPFELDARNGLTYGLDALVGLRLRSEDTDSTFSISSLAPDDYTGAEIYGPIQTPTGDAEFDERFRVRANEGGRRYCDRIGPDERRLFVHHHPHLSVYQDSGRAWISLPGELQREHLEAAARLVARLWPRPLK